MSRTRSALCLALLIATACNGEAAQRDAQRDVRNRLVDPASAQFRMVHLGKASNTKVPIVCGEVNAKNRRGRYDGFSRFIAIHAINAVDLQSDPSSLYSAKSWATLC